MRVNSIKGMVLPGETIN